MPKRVCPFDFDFFPQQKIHVSEKEVNSGVLMKNHMKQVQDKTIALLYKGARQFTDKLNATHEKNNGVQDCTHSVPDSYKQLFLTSSCRLQTYGKIEPVVINTCQSCRQPVDNSPDKCSFCDKMVCGLCGSSCMKCCEVYCRCCSLPDFSSTEESCICIGCA
ncbi:apoptosis regulatory protein Siva-like isoform X1 [Schistocerca americana]|uniref:apoptosis regulatory protein Siva-like isoform X1 n=1 Tax=Schistocerca americana TaxID=7009 RepID=UPI001F4F7563|nr:apoptosis regulatory protein Siva-like isoform X1 [Schistocerca americana]